MLGCRSVNGQNYKSFLVLFLKKERLASFRLPDSTIRAGGDIGSAHRTREAGARVLWPDGPRSIGVLRQRIRSAPYGEEDCWLYQVADTGGQG